MVSRDHFHYIHKPYLHTMSVVVAVPYGAVHEEVSLRGSAHLLEHVLPYYYEEQLREYGVDTYYSANREETVYAFTFHAMYAENVCAVIRAMFQSDNITDEALEHEMKVIVNEQMSDAPYEGSAYDTFIEKKKEHLFGGTAVGRDPIATREEVARITAGQLRQVFATYYIPQLIHIGCVGPVEQRTIEKYFAIDNGVYTHPIKKEVNFFLKGFLQQHIDTGHRGSGTIASWNTVVQKHSYEDTVCCNILAEILGRKFAHFMRDDRGVAYDASLRETHYTTFCIFNFEAVIPDMPHEEAIRLYQEFWAQVAITQNDVHRARKALCVALDFTQDAVATLAESLAIENVHYKRGNCATITPSVEKKIVENTAYDTVVSCYEQMARSGGARFYYGAY